MAAITLKCEICGKEIIGMSQKHAERLFRVHKYVKHEQKPEPKLSDQEKEILTLFRGMADEGRKLGALEILKGEPFIGMFGRAVKDALPHDEMSKFLSICRKLNRNPEEVVLKLLNIYTEKHSKKSFAEVVRKLCELWTEKREKEITDRQ
jgi:hypothetical protein